MVVVRLAKSGAKKNPYYFITVADSRKPRDGAFIERLGFFNPSAKGSEERMRFNVERLDHWISQGAQLSDKVKELAKDARLSSDELQAKLDAKKDKRTKKKEALKAQKIAELEAQAKEAPAEEAPAEEAAAEAEAPAEEAPAEEAAAEAETPAEEAPAEEAAAEAEAPAAEEAPVEELKSEESEEESSDDEKK
jgi:small subunit ribosomal protein S16